MSRHVVMPSTVDSYIPKNKYVFSGNRTHVLYTLMVTSLTVRSPGHLGEYDHTITTATRAWLRDSGRNLKTVKRHKLFVREIENKYYVWNESFFVIYTETVEVSQTLSPTRTHEI